MELKNIKFTVLVPILDRPDIVEGFSKALDSIYENSIKPDQVLVTVDGPVSKSFRKIIKKNELKYSLDIVWSEKKVGLDKALNLGLTKCKNEFIFRADGDDFNKDNRFEIQLPFLLGDIDVVGSYIDEFDECGQYISTKSVPLNDNEIEKSLPFRNPINHMTVGFKKSAVDAVGGYPELFLKGDYGLWIKLKAAQRKFKNINKSLVNATTGRRMIGHRGGLKYVISEIDLQKYLIHYKFSNILSSLIIFLLRATVFLLPSFLRSLIYKLFLRSRKNLKNKKGSF